MQQPLQRCPLQQAVPQALSSYLLQQFCWLSHSFTVLLIIPTSPHQSFASKVGIGVLFSNPKKSFSTFSRAVVIPAYAGVLLLAVSILFGTTCFPQWMVAITPLVTITLGFVWQYLPLKIGKPLTEYWNNLVFILMFGIMAAWLYSMSI